MNSLIKYFREQTLKRKLEFAAAVLLTLLLMVSIPVYAWFSNQRKAVEMFKVEYPNSLYINAAHREDRVYFDLDAIDVNYYERKADNDYKYYKYYQKSKQDSEAEWAEIDEADYNSDTEHYEYKKEPQKTTKFRYIFSVSGDNTEKFTLQLTHTNNNLFNYSVYEVTQYDYMTDVDVPEGYSGDKIVPVGTAEENIVAYPLHANANTENPITVKYDPLTSGNTSTKYYVRAANAAPVAGEYINNLNNSNRISQNNLAVKETNNKYYKGNYDTNVNVDAYAVPSYWQAKIPLDKQKEIDENKHFCKYFMLEVDCSENDQGRTKKETDIIYFSVARA